MIIYSGVIFSQESNPFDERLDQIYQLRTSDVDLFSKSLNEIRSDFQHLSERQKDYFKLLTGYEYWLKGNLKKATNQFHEVMKETQDIELNYIANQSLINLSSLEKNWLKGFKLLEKMSDKHENIKNKEIRHTGLIATAIFYNELEQYEMTKMYTDRLLNDQVSGRNLCVTLSIKIKAELSTVYIDSLKQEILDAIQTCKKINELIPTNILRNYLATFYLEKNHPEKAIELLESHLSEINNTHYQLLIVESSSLLAQAYLKTNDLARARKHALIAIKDIHSHEYVKVFVKAYKVLAAIALQQGELKLAYEYQDNYIRVKDALFEQTTAKQFAVESSKHHAVESKNQILLLNNQKKSAQLKLISQKQKLIFWSIILISLAILIFFWLYRKTTKKELLLQKQVNAELQELDKLKDIILTNTSHELRTPLNGIIGLSDLILLEYEDKLEDELIQSIKLIANSGAKLALIVNDLLDLAQLKSRRITFNYQRFEVSTLIREVIDLCQPLLKTDQIKIKFEEKYKDISICQDMNRIQQVLFNLIGNAIKFTNSGEITINFEQQSEFLWFNISDTGIGIPADKIDRIFEGFEQVDNSNSKTHQGSGLGLAICRETVTLLGGKIELRSEFGKGTIVSFYVPVLPSSENIDNGN